MKSFDCRPPNPEIAFFNGVLGTLRCYIAPPIQGDYILHRFGLIYRVLSIECVAPNEYKVKTQAVPMTIAPHRPLPSAEDIERFLNIDTHSSR